MMAFDTEKICRTCLALSGPFLSIYDSTGSSGCVADMLRDFTNITPKRNDGMPEKVCLLCISEINRSYSFKMKCENSEKMLKQLVPCPDIGDTIEEKPVVIKKSPISSVSQPKTDKSTEKSREKLLCSELEPDKNSSFETIPNKRRKLEQTTIEDLASEDKEGQTIHIIHDGAIKTGNIFLQKTEPKNDCTNNEENVVYSLQEDTCDENEDGVMETAYYLISDSQDNDDDDVEQALQEGHLNSDSHDGEDDDEADDDVDHHQVQQHSTDDNKESSNSIVIREIEVNDENKSTNESVLMSEAYDNQTTLNHSVRKRKSTFKKLTLQEATQNIEKKNDFKCSQCPMTFVFLRNLHKHIQRLHRERRKSENNEENKSTNNDIKKNNNADVAKSNDSKQVEKPIADINVIKPIKTNEITPVVEAKYHCPRCNAGFAQRKSRNNHLMQNKCTAEVFVCSECKKVFQLEANLEKHMKTHLSQFDCTECRETFPQKEQLNAHMIETHNRSMKYQCHYEECQKVFTMLSTLKDHLRIHTGEKPFLCSMCGKSFSQSANLKQHVMRHNKMKPYKCDECPTSFVSKAELFSHKRTHTGDHPFSCEFCHADFTTSSSLVKHRRKHTGERPYGCEFCPMRFTALNVLKNHRRTHTGEKPYKCNFCNRGFAQKSDCRIHMRIHSGERARTVCEVCDIACDDNEMLIEHLKTHYSEMEVVLQVDKESQQSQVTVEIISEDDIDATAETDVNEAEFVDC